ncbi:kinase-like protein [Hypoxylon trugodes]|uniref:kinase-like protein n=1 Tax=Hypoxylon trugodes TaxID=326681 RepID=UPI002190AF42|nr:kinase-like protein [Hypoxylon trugodes]KAI1391549.1 kinase-like protein [Hypoxylon trugodes]
MPIEEVLDPKSQNSFTFDQEQDLLGSGTVGEVFKVKHDLGDHVEYFALKRFFNRAGRDDFENEQNNLKALAVVPHEHVTYFISAWTISNASYMLFPLANGDLHHFLTRSPPPANASDVGGWLTEQMLGICDAIQYLHEYTLTDTDGKPIHRIGFHHDLKPANILLFSSSDASRATWKLADFGSGAVKNLPIDSNEELYNRKASTGDPVYSAPEYVVEGRVSRPKDIWSLGCIFLEVLIWVFTPGAGAVAHFREARDQFSRDNPDNRPVYWCQNAQGEPYVNPAVMNEIGVLKDRCGEGLYQSILGIVKRMLSLEPKERPTAVELCGEFGALRGK